MCSLDCSGCEYLPFHAVTFCCCFPRKGHCPFVSHLKVLLFPLFLCQGRIRTSLVTDQSRVCLLLIIFASLTHPARHWISTCLDVCCCLLRWGFDMLTSPFLLMATLAMTTWQTLSSLYSPANHHGGLHNSEFSPQTPNPSKPS